MTERKSRQSSMPDTDSVSTTVAQQNLH